MWILPCKCPSPSMHQVYSSAQRQFLEFYCQDHLFHSGQLLLPASEGTEMHFCFLVPISLHVNPWAQISWLFFIGHWNPDSVVLWTTCCLGFFGFLRAGEFTVNSSFNPTSHLMLADIQVDSPLNPLSFRIFIKCSKTDPFCRSCFVFLDCGSFLLCPVVSLENYLNIRGSR